MDETPNSGSCTSCAYSPCSSPCPDKVYWNNLGSSTTFTGSDGKVYTLEILGFADCSSPGTPISQFVTQENTNNVACIYAKITECAVTITGNPSPLSVCPGGTGSFKVNATGPALTYQWYKVGSPDQTTDEYWKVQRSYNVNPDHNRSYNYRSWQLLWKVTGSCGTSKTSTSALLTMSSPTTITTQPSSQTVCADSTAIFNVAATGSGTLTYQWQQSIDSGTNWSPITGQTGTSSTLTGVTASMNGYRYRVVVTGTCGSVTSNAAILTVQAKPTASAGPAQTVCTGSTVQLAGAASNFNQITWSGGAGTFSPNVNALNAVYTPTAGEIAAGTVALTMTATPKSPCATSATSNVVITIQAKPTTSAGSAQTVCKGSTVQLAGAASNYNQVTWSGGAGTFSPNANALNAAYTPTAGEIAAGTVALILTAAPKSPCTASATSNVVITIQAKPTTSAGSAQTVCAGSTVQLAGTASNFNQITWSGGAGTFSPNVNALNAVYTPTAGETAAGTVALILTAIPKSPCAASAASNVVITIYGPPTADFTATPSSGCPPLTVTFTDTSNGKGRIITGWTWDFGDGTTYSGQTPPVHIYPNKGTYTAKLTVTSSCGTGTKTAYITVSQPVVVPGTYGPACIIGSNVTLAGSPAGGTWLGDGVSGNIFHPSAAGPGNHVLTYQYTSGSSCSFSNTTTLTVVPLPQTTITVR